MREPRAPKGVLLVRQAGMGCVRAGCVRIHVAVAPCEDGPPARKRRRTKVAVAETPFGPLVNVCPSILPDPVWAAHAPPDGIWCEHCAKYPAPSLGDCKPEPAVA